MDGGGGRSPGELTVAATVESEVKGGNATAISEEDLVRESAEVARRLSSSRVVSVNSCDGEARVGVAVMGSCESTARM